MTHITPKNKMIGITVEKCFESFPFILALSPLVPLPDFFLTFICYGVCNGFSKTGCFLALHEFVESLISMKSAFMTLPSISEAKSQTKTVMRRFKMVVSHLTR